MNWDCHLYPTEVSHLKALADEGDALAAVFLFRYYNEYMLDREAAGAWLQRMMTFSYLQPHLAKLLPKGQVDRLLLALR
jgi:hypothetical protein